MVAPTQWPWVWVSSGSWWWTGRPGVLQSMGSQIWTQLSDRIELNVMHMEVFRVVPGTRCDLLRYYPLRACKMGCPHLILRSFWRTNELIEAKHLIKYLVHKRCSQMVIILITTVIGIYIFLIVVNLLLVSWWRGMGWVLSLRTTAGSLLCFLETQLKKGLRIIVCPQDWGEIRGCEGCKQAL